mgnify:CR=1 FL=1
MFSEGFRKWRDAKRFQRKLQKIRNIKKIHLLTKIIFFQQKKIAFAILKSNATQKKNNRFLKYMKNVFLQQGLKLPYSIKLWVLEQ